MEWFYAWLGGIRQTSGSTGFRELLIDPHPAGDVNQATTEYETPYGRVCCHWEKRENAMRMRLTIPENSTALIRVSADSPDKIRLDGSPLPATVPFVNEREKSFIRLGSGKYLLEF